MNISRLLAASLVRPFGIRLRTVNLFLISVGWKPDLIDLSNATRLKNSVFRVESQRVDWIITTLRTIAPEHRDLQQVTIYLPYDPRLSGADADIRRMAGELIFEEWLELDGLLTQLWESLNPSEDPVSLIPPPKGEQEILESMGLLLPLITGREIIDLFRIDTSGRGPRIKILLGSYSITRVGGAW